LKIIRLRFKLRHNAIIASLVLVIALCLISLAAAGQNDTVFLENPSFEGVPRPGDNSRLFLLRGWRDCGFKRFPSETPPDVHPGNFWDNNLEASDGFTYLGMVVRDNDSWEGVSQQLAAPIKKGKCYKLSVELAQSDIYQSHSRMTGAPTSFISPTVLRVWGGSTLCNSKELLAETVPVNHSNWITYEFTVHPRFEHSFIVVEAFYKTPVLLPYNGHILVDNMSHFIEIPCPENSVAGYLDPASPRTDIVPKPLEETIKERKAAPAKAPVAVEKPKVPEVKEVKTVEPSLKPVEKPKIMEELDIKKITTGSTMRIPNLYFQSDSTNFTRESLPVLDEIKLFMEENPKIKFEIAGHTNGIPKHDYCDSLSTLRAKSVYNYLISKGISPDRITFKGYGKRRRIASDATIEGRRKNQRVEIKVVDL
jgi:outer membrane protein OmpA-like peptidoglycan-associated protein